MSAKYELSQDDILKPLRTAIATHDSDAILEALPEPPDFLPALFRLDAPDRNVIIAGLFPVLVCDEDRWELIEASAMDSITHPERGSFVSIAPFIPDSLMNTTQILVASIRDLDLRQVMESALRSF